MPPERSSAEVEAVGHLPVDAEHRSGARVDEHLPSGVPLRVEVEAPFVLPAREVGADVADEERGRRRSRRRSVNPSMRPQRRRCALRRKRAHSGARTVAACPCAGSVIVTPLSSCARATTSWSQRTSISGEAAIAASRSSSVRAWEMLTNGGKGERPWSAKSTANSSRSLVVGAAGGQVRPSSATRSPTLPPARPDVDHVPLLDDAPWTRLGRARARVEHDDRDPPAGQAASAAVWPTGPAPITTTRRRNDAVASSAVVGVGACASARRSSEDRKSALAPFSPAARSQTSRSRSAVQIRGQSMPLSSSQSVGR